MIKIRINNIDPELKELKWDFPCLGEDKHDPCFIVLFGKHSEGIVLEVGGDTRYDLFQVDDTWDMSCFKPIGNKRIIIECN